MSEIVGWHCSNGRLNYGDGRRIRKGITHRVDGPLSMCSHGLHASVRPLDTLQYAPIGATTIARVRLHGEVIHGDDKCVATHRTYLAVIPMRPILDEFACCCAEAALMIGDVPDERCWQAIHVKREWLAGHATNADLNAAWDAAGAAAGEAARTAAWDEINALLESMLLDATGGVEHADDCAIELRAVTLGRMYTPAEALELPGYLAEVAAEELSEAGYKRRRAKR